MKEQDPTSFKGLGKNARYIKTRTIQAVALVSEKMQLFSHAGVKVALFMYDIIQIGAN